MKGGPVVVDRADALRFSKCLDEARKQDLNILTEDDGTYHLMKAAQIGGPLESGGTILSQDRFRLPDGRVVPMRMTLAELDTFFGLS